MPFGFHLAVDTLPSGNRKRWLQVRLGCVQLSPSCPFRLLHTFLSPGPRGITPAFGYGAPHPSARGTSTLPINALLSAHYEPLGLPPGSARFPPSGFMRTVFARLGCQVGSLLFRPLLVQTCHRPLPRRGPAIVPVRTAVCCLRRHMSGSALPNTFRLIICRGFSVHLILRPACLLPSFSKALDAPLWPVASLPSAGACYRALRRLPGQVLSLLEERVFQDAACAYSNAGTRSVRENIAAHRAGAWGGPWGCPL